GELLLTHLFEGVEMQPDYMNETLKNLQALWARPVNLATVIDGAPKLIRFDGAELKEFAIGQPEQQQSEG
ncbi:MAG TPA: hypothetical protein VM432_05465, partial [Bdellovibrionales bacterium]|nr:hypothetical protein [Bdellovibrionales bacterium]